jgi:DNA-directed RNA polymerase specialized sigma24 family protein
MSASDVAEMLGLTVQNVYSNLSAAKRQLKESLAALMKHGADT